MLGNLTDLQLCLLECTIFVYTLNQMQAKRHCWLLEGLCQMTCAHHKLFCEFMHDQNVLQLCGHILYIACMTSHNDALCPVKHSYCLKYVYCCL